MKTSQLQLKKPLRPVLEQQGHAFFSGNDVSIQPQLGDAVQEFHRSFDDLPVDPYASSGTWFRRYSTYIFLPADQLLLPTSSSTYFQSAAYNSLNGGQHRRFEPLPQSVRTNPFLLALIEMDFHALPVAGQWLERPFQVGVHQISQRPPQGPAPAFAHPLHKDGEWWTFSHLERRQNVRGGVGIIADNQKETVWEGTQESFLDTFVVVDSQVYHTATPIERVEPDRPAWRNILLVDFTPLVPLIDLVPAKAS